MCLTCWSESAPSYCRGLVARCVFVYCRVPSHVGYIWTWPAFCAARLSDAVSRFSLLRRTERSLQGCRTTLCDITRTSSESCEQSKGHLLPSSSLSARDDDTLLSLVMFSQPIQRLSKGWLVSQDGVFYFLCSFFGTALMATMKINHRCGNKELLQLLVHVDIN